MRETVIERHLVQRVKALGGVALKLSPAGSSGWPDRIVVLPGGWVGFIELKAPGEEPRRLQQVRLTELAALGLTVAWTDSREGVDAFLAALRGGQGATE